MEFGEALKTYRKLARNDPDAFLSYVAHALDNLGGLVSDQGRPKKPRGI